MKNRLNRNEPSVTIVSIPEDNISPYDSEKLAIGNFNTKAAAAMKKAECNFALTIRIDGTGKYADFDVFERK